MLGIHFLKLSSTYHYRINATAIFCLLPLLSDALWHVSRRTRTPTETKGKQMENLHVRILQQVVNRTVNPLSHTVQLFKSLLSIEESKDVEAKREDIITRNYRERAALFGQCVICYDDDPNIATLCCGQAVHLNCLADWLSLHQTCEVCRGYLPRYDLSANTIRSVIATLRRRRG